MPVGMIQGESSETYHASPDLSHSKLEDFRFREAYFHGRHVIKTIPVERTKPLVTGAALHCYGLEGIEAFNRQFAVVPEDAPKRPSVAQLRAKNPSAESLAAIQYWHDFKAAASGREIIDADTFALIKRLSDAILSNAFAADLMTAPGVHSEVTFRTPPLRGFPVGVQCKADQYNPLGCERSAGVPYAVDLKSCEDLNKWGKQYFDYGYYRQGAFYRTTIKTVAALEQKPECNEVERFFFVAFEKQEPHGVTVFEADQISLAEGLRENTETLAQLRHCFEANRWLAGKEFSSVGLPPWKLAEIARRENA